MKKFLFADLDDTLFQTPHKCSAAQQAELEVIAYYQDTSPCSYTTRQQRAFLAMVAQGELQLIPTTARDLNALGRVEMVFSSYRIANFGGVILRPDGSQDTAWRRQMEQALAPAQAQLPAILNMLDTYLAQQSWPARARIVTDVGLDFYALVKEGERSAPHLQQMAENFLQPWLNDQGKDFYLHRNANNLAILPKALNKANAVRQVQAYLRAEFDEILSIGIGDSASDAAFLAACDYAMMPTASQLAQHTLELI